MAPAQRVRYPLRVKASLAAVVLLSLWGSFEFWNAASEKSRAGDPFQVTAQSQRFAGFAAEVPENAVLGYLSDLPMEDATAQAMFPLAQYALAPRLLENSLAPRQVLGNFTRPAAFAALGSKHGLVLEKDFGNGVVLFRREGR